MRLNPLSRTVHGVLFVLIAVFIGGTAHATETVTDRYVATLPDYTSGKAYDATSTDDDVWQLASFNYALNDTFAVQCGAATAVVGASERNILWIVILPVEPGTIVRAPVAEGARVRSIWIRCNPAVGMALLNTATHQAPEPERDLRVARRIARFKMTASYHRGGRPTVPQNDSVVFDIETDQGRRFFLIDTKEGTVRHEPYFDQHAMPALAPLSPEQVREVFETVWQSFDREYAMFAIKPDVDWAAQRERFEPQLAQCETNADLAELLAQMLATLEDLHVNVQVNGQYLPVFSRSRPLNANWQAIQSNYVTFSMRNNSIAAGRTADDIGYISVFQLQGDGLVPAFDNALDQLRDTNGLIIDLRFNGGGDETLAQQMAGRFISQPTTYAHSQYRTGPKHDDLGPRYPRECSPRGPWTCTKPVVVLHGRKTTSSAESFAAMFSGMPQVTTMGAPTAGSSGNPRVLELAGGITVTLPRWIDYRPDGTPIDAVGIEPEIPVDWPAQLADPSSDPVLDAALAHLEKCIDE
jgi:carboxyl-terminal processing protease